MVTMSYLVTEIRDVFVGVKLSSWEHVHLEL